MGGQKTQDKIAEYLAKNSAKRSDYITIQQSQTSLPNPLADLRHRLSIKAESEDEVKQDKPAPNQKEVVKVESLGFQNTKEGLGFQVGMWEEGFGLQAPVKQTCLGFAQGPSQTESEIIYYHRQDSSEEELYESSEV